MDNSKQNFGNNFTQPGAGSGAAAAQPGASLFSQPGTANSTPLTSPTTVAGKPYTAAFTQPINSPISAPAGMPQANSASTASAIPGLRNAGTTSTGATSAGATFAGTATQGATPQVAQPIKMPQVQTNPVTGAPMIMQAPAPASTNEKDKKSLFMTIGMIALSLVSVTFIGLFIWMFSQYNNSESSVTSRVNSAVSAAVAANTEELESEFAEREKDPYRVFAGPADYGSLTFEYPKTWSLYIARDAAGGGDYEAYFNPIEVHAINNENINSLRLFIRDVPFDDIAAGYQGDLEGEEPRLSLNVVNIGVNNDVSANYYTGLLPGTEFSGYIVIFKIRDKTVVMQCDSTLFEGDFNTLLSTIDFNA